MFHPTANTTRVCFLALTASGLIGAGPADAWQPATNLSVKADLSLKEAYDSNVYLQDTAPNNAVPDAVPAKKDSWVTTVTPRMAADYRPYSAFNLSLSYAPDYTTYHNAHSEDYFAHRAGLTLSGAADDLIWEQINAFTYIDGNHLGPTFGRPQDVPAIGGIPLRDRRDAFIYRGGLRLTYSIGDFFLRPVASAYEHDFLTEQRLNTSRLFVYENYLDRQDVNGGLDVGYNVGKSTSVVVGYRYGQQDQFTGPNASNTAFTDSPYDSRYHRVLFGIEGAPASWLKLAVLGGPDIRTWSQAAHQVRGFDTGEMLYWIDAGVTLLPTSQDSIALLSRRYEQPAFSSQSVYEDITYSVNWKHRFDDHWSGSAGFQLYIGDWQAPVQRDDWIYTPSVGLTYTHDKHLSAEVAYSYDWVENHAAVAPGQTQYADGREYTRHLVAATLKYGF